MSQQVLRKRPPKQQRFAITAPSSANLADLNAVTSGRIRGLHIFLRPTSPNVKIRLNFNRGLDDSDLSECELTIKDITKLYLNLNQLFRSLKQDGESDNLRKRIAEESWYFYKKLVPEEDRRRISELHSQYLVEESTLKDGSFLRPYSILVKAFGVTIPWEFLYIENPWDADKAEIVCDERFFLGYWALIKQDVTQNKRTDERLNDFGEDGVKIFFDHNLNVARDSESPGIKEMFEHAGLKAHFAEKLASDAEPGAFLGELARKSGCIVHMACHSSSSIEDSRGPYIRLNENYFLEEREVRLGQKPVIGQPLLFLNSCEMALVQPESYCQFLNYFFERGFSAIVATEIEISDTAAWDFAKRVYAGFLAGDSSVFDVAIFDARRAFLRDFESLIGFTYSYYGLGNLQLTECEGRT